MQSNRIIRGLARTAAGFLAVAAFVVPSAVFAAIPPHVPLSTPTDSCAICHRVHSANTAQSWVSTPTMESTGTSLLLSDDPSRGDVTLCFACHGIGQLGSNKDVQSAFEGSSVHTLAPDATPYGPTPMYCSTCHDPHGSARTIGNSPYPALLRSYEGTHTVLTGEAYCATCHTAASIAQENEHWSGVAVFAKTAHFSGIATPTTGTGIRCSRCHAPHGSNVAPLLVGSIVPTSVVDTFTVTADDRSFCVACHPVASASWEGTPTYAASGHGASSVVTTISARWVPAGKRKVGECQVCHAPMGRDDGTGNPVPKLLDAAGRSLCDRCHAVGGVAPTDTSSQARPVLGASTLVAVYDPSTYEARALLYGGRTTTGALEGPRSFATPATLAAANDTLSTATGDIDGDGRAELVVASSESANLYVYRQDALTGIATTLTVPVPGGVPTAFIAIADVLDPLTYQALPEIVLGDTSGAVSVYEFSGGSLLALAGPYTSGAATLTGLTAGDVRGSALSEAVATFTDGNLLAVGDDGSHGVTTSLFSVKTGAGLVAPVVADLWDATPAANEVAVVDASAPTDNVSIVGYPGGTATLLGTFTVTSGTRTPVAAAAGQLLTGVGAAGRVELAIAFSDPATDDSAIVVVPQSVSVAGLDPALAVSLTTGAHARTRSLLAGDVDGDGTVDLVAGNGGRPSFDANALSPSVQIWRANAGGTDFVAAEEHFAGGSDLAPSVPALALAYLGPIFPSRHPMDAGSGSHVSTETLSAAAHVTCSDCHNSHAAVAAATTAPTIQGVMRGAWGVGVTYSAGAATFAAPATATKSYQVCFRCHSSDATVLAFDPANASMHAVVQDAATSTVPAATFVGDGATWTAASVLYCTDCHGDDGASGAQAKGPHESASAPLLIAPFTGSRPSDTGSLCYDCHKVAVYGVSPGPDASASFFTSAGTALHPSHSARGVSCAACHVSHGSVTNPALLRSDIGYLQGATIHEGSCTNACHGGTPRFWQPAP